MLRLKLFVAVAGLVAGAAFASPSAPKPGAEYTALSTPQPAQSSGKKIEVIEFFMYHCPACNALEPTLNEWVKKQGDNIVFRRVHIPHTGAADPEAHLFLTLEALQMEGGLHAKVMNTWHVERRRLKDDADNLDWAAKNGIDKDKFLAAYNSFSVLAKLRNAGRTASNYDVDSTPTLVVDGRYLTNPSMVETSNPGVPRDGLGQATMQVVDALIAASRH